LQHDTAPLAEIAAALGFADQAHFTRVVRQHLSHTPAALRRTLRSRCPTPRRAPEPSG
jgi:transcriptional regulator GlxA family with amidase domain